MHGSRDELTEQAHAVRRDAVRLAGRPTDLVQRASVYFHLYSHSGGNHVFPLLAAHGALWGSGHFARGLAIGRVLATLTVNDPDEAQGKLDQLAALATAFKDINRQVCAETYACYHLTRLHGEHPGIEAHFPAELVLAMNRCHAANRRGTPLTDDEKKTLFDAFFLWEQEHIVGPGVEAAVAKVDWPLMMWLAMKPPVGFSYFGTGRWLWFSDFASTEQRIARGRDAFDLAARAGWDRVAEALGDYSVMPATFFQCPDRHFDAIKRTSRICASV